MFIPTIKRTSIINTYKNQKKLIPNEFNSYTLNFYSNSMSPPLLWVLPCTSQSPIGTLSLTI